MYIECGSSSGRVFDVTRIICGIVSYLRGLAVIGHISGKALLESDRVKTGAKWAIFAAIIAYLIFKMSKIGWGEILTQIPTSPLFYVLSIGFVVAPVVAEMFSFQTITRQKAWPLARVFLRKHVMNKAVINFSGDAYFAQKLTHQSDMNLRQLAILLKDMTLIRAFVANVWIVGLALAAILFGQFDVLRTMASASPVLVVGMSLFSLTVIGGGLFWFRKLTRLKWGVAGKVAAVYIARSVVVGTILISQWSLAIPGQEIATWFVFLIIFYIAKKSPIGGELLFASIIVTLPGIGGDSAPVAAMLIAIAAVTQLFYFAAFLLTFDAEHPKNIKARRKVA